MRTFMPISIYVTGTDTDAGKTGACIALLHALRRSGASAVGMKPVASGSSLTLDGYRNDDALALQSASDPTPDYALVNPLALIEPTAPEIAAAVDGVEVALPALIDAFKALTQKADHVVVEGVGGWMAPLSRELMQVDLVRALQLPVILVVGVRLGCINHALLSLRALRADAVSVVGWVASMVDRDMRFADETLAILGERLDVPCIGVLTNPCDFTLAALDVSPLLAAARRCSPLRLIVKPASAA